MRAVTAATLALLLTLASAALAEPARNGDFLPIEIGASATGSVVVQPGDHLWKIAADHLAGSDQTRPAPTVVVPYWREVIAVNRDRLRSGDPDLIYPGEVILLPESG